MASVFDPVAGLLAVLNFTSNTRVDQPVILVVGPHDVELRTPRSLLALTSPPFQSACGTSSPHLLPDDEPSIVENYFKFLLLWVIPRDTYGDIAYLYSFARRYKDIQLANNILDLFAMAAQLQERDSDGLAVPFSPEVAAIVFGATEPNDPLRRLLADTLFIYGAEKVQDLDGWPHVLLDMICDMDRTLASLGFTIHDEVPDVVLAAWYKEAETGEDTREKRSMTISNKWDKIPPCFTTEQAEAVSRSFTGIKAKRQRL